MTRQTEDNATRPPGDQPSCGPGSRRHRWLWLSIASLGALFQLRWWWHPTEDGCNYLSIARGLSRGVLDARGSEYLHHLPGYSLLISPAFWFGDQPFIAISLIHVGFAVALIWALMRWLGPLAGGWAPLVAAFVLVNPGLWEQLRYTQSEAAFVPMLVIAAVVVRQALEAESRRAWLGWVALAAAAVTFAGLIRHAGVLLVGGLMVAGAVMVWRGRLTMSRWVMTTAVVGVVAVVVVGGWTLRDRAVSERIHGTYRAWNGTLPRHGESKAEQLVESGRMRIEEAGRLTVPGMIKAYTERGQWLHVNTIVYLCVSLALLYGWWRMARRHADPLLWSLPFLLVLNVFYPGDAGTRYTVPLLPIIGLSVYSLCQLRPRWGRRVLEGLVLVHLVVAIVYWAISLEAVERHGLWDEVARVEAALPEDATGVYGVALDRLDRQMLEVGLNRRLRPVGRAASKADALAEARWLIVGSEDALGAGAEPLRIGPWWLVEVDADR